MCFTITLNIWIPPIASKYLWVNDIAMRLDYFIRKFTNSIQYLMEVLVDCLYGPPK
jgi:hypothetical protein